MGVALDITGVLLVPCSPHFDDKWRDPPILHYEIAVLPATLKLENLPALLERGN
jgi:hypothetical protein